MQKIETCVVAIYGSSAGYVPLCCVSVSDRQDGVFFLDIGSSLFDRVSSEELLLNMRLEGRYCSGKYVCWKKLVHC